MSDARDQFTKVAVVFLLAGAIGFGVLEGNGGASRVKKGTPAPSFKVDRLTGGTATIDELSGKVVLLAFWGTWCPPCREELPYLVSIADEYKDKGATLLAVNDADEDRANMPDYVEHQLPGLKPYAAWGNPEIFRNYGIESMPQLYLLSTSGSVIAHWGGFEGPGEIAAVRAKLDATLKR
ncbi:MAG: TlpA disulfide reductase family protein [Myxococcaceae bacterium]